VSFVDLLILVAVGLLAGKGWWKGFFVEAFTFVGYFAALFITLFMYKAVGQALADWLDFNPHLTSVLAFVVLFILIAFGFSLAGQALTKGVAALELTGLNRFFGAVFGAAKGAFLCGVFMAVLTEKPLFASLAAEIKTSALAPYLIDGANALLNLLGM
jgi:membrane protein required for colicin V production